MDKMLFSVTVTGDNRQVTAGLVPAVHVGEEWDATLHPGRASFASLATVGAPVRRRGRAQEQTGAQNVAPFLKHGQLTRGFPSEGYRPRAWLLTPTDTIRGIQPTCSLPYNGFDYWARISVWCLCPSLAQIGRGHRAFRALPPNEGAALWL